MIPYRWPPTVTGYALSAGTGDGSPAWQAEFADGSVGLLVPRNPNLVTSMNRPAEPAELFTVVSSGGHSDVWRDRQHLVPATIPSWFAPLRAMLLAPGYERSDLSDALLAVAEAWLWDFSDDLGTGRGELDPVAAYTELLRVAEVQPPPERVRDVAHVWQRLLTFPFRVEFPWNRSATSTWMPASSTGSESVRSVRFCNCLFDVDAGDGSGDRWRARLRATTADQAQDRLDDESVVFGAGEWLSGNDLVDREAMRALTGDPLSACPSELAMEWLWRVWRLVGAAGSVDPALVVDPTPVWLEALVDWAQFSSGLLSDPFESDNWLKSAASAVLFGDRVWFEALTGESPGAVAALAAVDRLLVDGVSPFSDRAPRSWGDDDLF